MKTKLMLLGIAMLFLVAVSFADTKTVCLSNLTAQSNTTITIISNGVSNVTTISENITCQYGCDNSTGGTNQCWPERTKPTIFVIIPPIVMFFLAFLMLYIAVNIKEYKALQFMFLGMALFLMIGQAWYMQNEADRTLALSDSQVGVLGAVYQMLIVVTIITVFYFILEVLVRNWKNIQKKKHGITDDNY